MAEGSPSHSGVQAGSGRLRRKVSRFSFLPCCLRLSYVLKGYAGGLDVVLTTFGSFAYRRLGAPGLTGFTDDGVVSFIAWWGRFSPGYPQGSSEGSGRIEVNDDVRRFERQDALIAFQLESLILAQNERWRQA